MRSLFRHWKKSGLVTFAIAAFLGAYCVSVSSPFFSQAVRHEPHTSQDQHFFSEFEVESKLTEERLFAGSGDRFFSTLHSLLAFPYPKTLCFSWIITQAFPFLTKTVHLMLVQLLNTPPPSPIFA